MRKAAQKSVTPPHSGKLRHNPIRKVANSVQTTLEASMYVFRHAFHDEIVCPLSDSLKKYKVLCYLHCL
ncbi:hypothetical protein HNY73_005437 [Argiope bruennichi]|uniref:Uncharacterized protein n=1 Tax=Argiope bruennichi TaxID=94029 RepID=A0A8T0FGK0_ARGBR|nr:hypothetical protein HNY73_005437 [Argiope bruennichi]